MTRRPEVEEDVLARVIQLYRATGEGSSVAPTDKRGRFAIGQVGGRRREERDTMTRDEAGQAIREYHASVKKLADHLQPLIPAGYCGRIMFKIFRGSITGVEEQTSTRKPTEKERKP